MTELPFPIDGTFLSSAIYEGVLSYYACKKDNFDCIKKRVRDITSGARFDIPSTGKNDQSFFRELGRQYQYTYGEEGTLLFLRNLLENVQESPKLESVEMQIGNIIFEKDAFVIGNKNITGLQLFKCDRYSGFTSLETNYTTSQITLRTSPEVALTLLIGVASSFIDRADNFYCFLFFSPDEIVRLYSERNNIDLVRKYFMVKDKAIEILRTAYLAASPGEIAIMELALNLKLQEEMNKYNLDKVSFMLFRIAREGNTYKIYEQIPLTLYRRIVFRDIVEKYFKNPERFIKKLSKIFEEKDKKPYFRLWNALRSLSRQQPESEASNVLSAIMNLYRFVILGDPQGYYQFLRELHNCYRKAETEGNEKKSEDYRRIIDRLRVS